ncbi:MAG TPA: 5-deoxy-glucuronate isomerase [Solirubrobacteraceae bacterium]
MTNLLVRPRDPAPDGTIVSVTPESAAWGHVGFEVLALDAGRTARRATEGKELCVVVVDGICRVSSEHGDWELGGRTDPFSGPPAAAYLPPRTEVALTGDGEVALCWAPADGGAPARVLQPGAVEVRGRDSFERRIHNILMADEAADALLVTEVLTPGGHWSSYPPHKHDRDAMPDESFLEETYYHRIVPAHGFGLQRVYTGDGSLDESVAVRDRDTVLVPRGYHTVSAPPGYDLYYLNVMAGPKRAWAIANDPDHDWMLR